MSVGVIVKKYNHPDPLHCRILDFEPKPFRKMERWLIVNNLDKEEYDNTKNIALLIPINHTDIEVINYQID